MDWTLVVATYNRPHILKVCVELALRQTRPPFQVVVVDASVDWEQSRDLVTATAQEHPAVELMYLQAEQRSLAAQRNQALPHVRGDVVFFIDDDSLMHPDCAAKILDVYEADSDGVVQGVQASLSDELPAGLTLDEPSKPRTKAAELSGRGVGRVEGWLWRHVLLWGAEAVFMPYDAAFPDWTIPSNVRPLVTPTRLFHGCRMTFRTRAIAAEGFEGTLRGWSAGEDQDASYRVSRHGALVTADAARLCHYESANARLDRRKVRLLSCLNQALFIRRNAPDLGLVRRRYYRVLARRVLAESIKDLGGRRLSLPQVRGLLAAARLSFTVFAIDEDRLDDWFVAVQEQVLYGAAPRR